MKFIKREMQEGRVIKSGRLEVEAALLHELLEDRLQLGVGDAAAALEAA